MIQEGFIDESNRGFKLHNWKKNQPYAYYGEERSAQARKAAKARYSPKSLKKEACYQQADSTAPSPDPAPAPSPDPKPKKEPSRLSAQDKHDMFNHFWQLTPRRNGLRKGKAEAREKFNRIVKDEDSYQLLCTAIQNYASECEATDTYPKDAHRWLSKDRWKEYIPENFEPPQAGAQRKDKSAAALAMEMTLEARDEELRGEGFDNGYLELLPKPEDGAGPY
jgi:hypothetical protein